MGNPCLPSAASSTWNPAAQASSSETPLQSRSSGMTMSNGLAATASSLLTVREPVSQNRLAASGQAPVSRALTALPQNVDKPVVGQCQSL